MYWPDFILLVEDGQGTEDLLQLVVEIKGYRREDAKEKKNTMTTYWLPAVNRLGGYGRWAFAEFCDVHEMEAEFDRQLRGAIPGPGAEAAGESAALSSAMV